MMKREQIHEILSEYDPREVKIGVLGSHSALEMGHGAKQEGFEVVVVCQKGREKTYTKHYRNLFDHVLLLDKFVDIIKEENQAKLRQLNTIFVPNRSSSVYTGYDNIEQKFKVPLLGNRNMLRSEERNVPNNQYDLIVRAGLNLPKIFKSPEEIDRLAIVKVPEKCISSIIGKEGKNIAKIEERLGVGIDIRALGEYAEKPTGKKAGYNIKESSKTISFELGGRYFGKDIDIYVDKDYIATFAVGKKGLIKIKKQSALGRIILTAIREGEKIELRVK